MSAWARLVDPAQARPGFVNIFLVRVDCAGPLEHILELLSPEERDRVRRSGRPDWRAGYARRRATLRTLLAWLMGQPIHALKITSDSSGQPAIGDLSLHLACDSLDDRLLVALATRSRLGVCLHAVPPTVGPEVDRLFANHELFHLRQEASADRPRAVTQMFARKDAARRLTGQLPSAAASGVRMSPPAGGIAVATVAGEPPIGVVDLHFGGIAVGAVAVELPARDIRTWSVDYGMISA